MSGGIVGVCGRQGAGKSSISSFLTGLDAPCYKMVKTNDAFAYICDVVFGAVDPKNEKDSVWGMTRFEQEEMLRKMILEYVDSKWFDKHRPNEGPFGGFYEVPQDVVSSENIEWVEMSFAWSLKKICSVIFDVSFEMLLGLTKEAREHRETENYGHRFDRVPNIPFTGRVILEYFGTNVMRTFFDIDVWLKILQRDAMDYNRRNVRVVIPDVRFENEITFLKNIDAILLVV